MNLNFKWFAQNGIRRSVIRQNGIRQNIIKK